jgi:hypothetical protein
MCLPGLPHPEPVSDLEGQSGQQFIVPVILPDVIRPAKGPVVSRCFGRAELEETGVFFDFEAAPGLRLAATRSPWISAIASAITASLGTGDPVRAGVVMGDVMYFCSGGVRDRRLLGRGEVTACGPYVAIFCFGFIAI